MYEVYTTPLDYPYGDQCIFFYSFVRSTTMDKWKDSELERMKVQKSVKHYIQCVLCCDWWTSLSSPQVGGNGRAKDFFASQSDFTSGTNITDKYNSRAAALYRDKVSHIHHVILSTAYSGRSRDLDHTPQLQRQLMQGIYYFQEEEIGGFLFKCNIVYFYFRLQHCLRGVHGVQRPHQRDTIDHPRRHPPVFLVHHLLSESNQKLPFLRH